MRAWAPLCCPGPNLRKTGRTLSSGVEGEFEGSPVGLPSPPHDGNWGFWALWGVLDAWFESMCSPPLLVANAENEVRGKLDDDRELRPCPRPPRRASGRRRLPVASLLRRCAALLLGPPQASPRRRFAQKATFHRATESGSGLGFSRAVAGPIFIRCHVQCAPVARSCPKVYNMT